VYRCGLGSHTIDIAYSQVSRATGCEQPGGLRSFTTVRWGSGSECWVLCYNGAALEVCRAQMAVCDALCRCCTMTSLFNRRPQSMLDGSMFGRHALSCSAVQTRMVMAH
jgi:hypothetical protein